MQGHSAGTATWVTNVGNERGEVLVSVLTDSEGLSSLDRMAKRLMGRYDCCLHTFIVDVSLDTGMQASLLPYCYILIGTAAVSVVPLN